MKSTFKALVILLVLTGIHTIAAAQKPVQLKNREEILPGIILDKTIADLGEIEEGSNATAVFKLYNTGIDSVVLHTAMGHIAWLSYDKSPLAPGGNTEITIGFDSKGKPGYNTKVYTFYSNRGRFDLTIKLHVVPPKSKVDTKITWDKTEFDFGNVNQGDTVKTTFTCYNRSDTSLVFENVLASCGCVVPNWPHKSIMPKDSAKMEVIFHTAGKSRQHVKTITVYSNQGLFDLTIKANILKPRD